MKPQKVSSRLRLTNRERCQESTGRHPRQHHTRTSAMLDLFFLKWRTFRMFFFFSVRGRGGVEEVCEEVAGEGVSFN